MERCLYSVILAFYLIVVIDPYEDLDYDKINVYEVSYGQPREAGITVHEPDYSDCEVEEEDESEELPEWLFPKR